MLSSVEIENFRNYSRYKILLDPKATLIVGPNAIGKTNILEAIYALGTGRSFRADEEREVIKSGESLAEVRGEGEQLLQIFWDNRERFQKIYRVNGVGKRQVDFIGNLRAVLFSPLDLEIVVNGPAVRRKYLDLVLPQVSKEYRLAIAVYERGLRQRNRLLRRIRDENLRPQDYADQLEYWNDLLITNGGIIFEGRNNYFEFLNKLEKKVFPVQIKYDHSIISPNRLLKYREEEKAAGATLIGPHRDDFRIFDQEGRDIHSYGSRGEQRLAIFAIKLGELEYILHCSGSNPILLLDDIFSELDHANRHHILEVIPKQQTIMTTTDLHLVEKGYVGKVKLVELG
jgi:DNA replication and repair protein RecF